MDSKTRGQWGSRYGFILAAIGSAIGLGNLWRFPYVAASNGGGAFLIPYFFALLSAGIPILILEFSVAHIIKKGAPGCFGHLNKHARWIGWFQAAISCGIIVYYIAIVAWTIHYFIFSFNLSWGSDTEAFFFNDFLHVSNSPLSIGGINTGMLVTLILVWAINCFVIIGGIKGGIEIANKIFMPLLIICLLIITFTGITLPGASAGLEYFFKPNFQALTDPSVWIAAYGQIFYSLSVCFGIMITYASYLPEDTDIVNNGFITGLGNCSFSIMAGIAIFSALGYMAMQQGVSVEEVSAGGIGLAFVVFPAVINALPGMNSLTGVAFFLCLTFAGLSSSISILEVITSSLSEKFDVSRKCVTIIVSIIGCIISMIFISDAGLYILDIVDHFINTYAIALAGLIEIIFLTHVLKLDKIRHYANMRSDYTIGRWWNITLKYVTPILLSIMFIFNIFIDFTQGYGGYSLKALLVYGGGVLVLIAVFAIIFDNIKGAADYEESLGQGITYDWEDK